TRFITASSSFSSTFSFSGPGYHPALPSFPTRRSSDLERLFKMTDFSRDESVRRFARQLRRMGVDDALRERGAKHGDTVRLLGFRSEEHTSELQSRENLVCRLLLEKKKNNQHNGY